MFYLIEKITKAESRVLAMHHDFGAMNDLSLAYQTVGRYEYEIVSSEFSFEEPEENGENGDEVDEPSVEEPPKPIDPNSYQAFKLKTAYCDAEVRFLIECFCSSFSIADVADMLNKCLAERFPERLTKTPISDTDLNVLTTVTNQNQED